MVKIRLARYGHKNAPFYRIVATSERSKREGKPLEVLGHFDPSQKTLKIQKERIKSWLEKGAQITSGAAKLIEKEIKKS